MSDAAGHTAMAAGWRAWQAGYLNTAKERNHGVYGWLGSGVTGE